MPARTREAGTEQDRQSSASALWSIYEPELLNDTARVWAAIFLHSNREAEKSGAGCGVLRKERGAWVELQYATSGGEEGGERRCIAKVTAQCHPFPWEKRLFLPPDGSARDNRHRGDASMHVSGTQTEREREGAKSYPVMMISG